MKRNYQMGNIATAKIPDAYPELHSNAMDDALELAKGRQDHLRAHGDEGFTDYVGGRRHSLLAFAGGRNV